MVSVPGKAFSNTRPSTTAMLAIGSLQISLLLFLAGPINAWLKRETPWVTVIVVAQHIMTIYLWHLTVVIAVVGLSLAFGGIGLTVEPGSGAWWSYRPLWIAFLIALLLPFIAIFGRFEAGARQLGNSSTGMLQAGLGALLTCSGLTVLALSGISSDRFPGFNWTACALTVAGVALATGRTFGSRLNSR